MSRKVILYIAASLDGYIAQPNDDLSFLNIVEKEGEDYGYAEFIRTVDTVILGRKTYDWIMKHVPQFVHADKETYVVTRTERAGGPNLHFYTGSLRDLVARLKTSAGKHIFLDGGAAVVHEFLKDQLIDELVISIIPIMVGGGVKLFSDGRPEQLLELVSVKQFEKGLVQLHYKVAGQ